nr:DUF2953 domain-containing protein [Eubacterium sp.]
MAVLLAVLKFIGILLLVVLGIVILACLAVLFVPVRYVVKCQSIDTLQVGYSVSWLWRTVCLRKEPSDEEMRLYIFGINAQNIKEMLLRSKEEDKPERMVAPEESKVQMVDEFYQDSDLRVMENKPPKVEIETDYEEEKAQSDEQPKTKKKSFSFQRISSIINFIRDNENKVGFRKLKKEFVDLLRYLMPQEVRGKVRFGTGDPCTTGWVLGGISMFPVAYTEGLRVVPDFEEKILKADGFLKGRLRVIYFVRLLLRGYLDDDIKKIVMKIMEFI